MNAVDVLKSVNAYLGTIDGDKKLRCDDMGIKAAKDLLKLIARAKTMSIKDLRHLLV